LRELGRFDEAIDCFNRALTRNRNSADTYIRLATVYNLQKRYPEAVAALDEALKIAPDRADAQALRLFLAATLCDWDTLRNEAAAIPTLGVAGKAVQPFMLLALDDDPARNRIRAERLTQERYALPEFDAIDRPATEHTRLRLGYFSADFHDHAVLFQLIRVLELHDRKAFEVHAYSYGPVTDSAMQARARRAVDHFHEVRDRNAKEIAELARQDGIDIAIDLMGHTRNGRLDIFAYRAAPVQVTYLGYPGTLGASFMDYMIADRIIVPAALRAHYAEKIIFMPHAHMATDNTKIVEEFTVTRRDMGLPETAFVFCCFNNSYKIAPEDFDIWMRLLHQVNSGVLWLAGLHDLAQRNLTRAARKHGINPKRLVFSPRVELATHLARYHLADLFLDTTCYNGHATAADALWAGLPVLTRPGRGFQARVEASLLTAVGLDELIAETAEDYERVALELASNPYRLAALKQCLRDNKARMPLFDTERFTKNLEEGYRQAYRRWFEGEAPEDIVLQDSTWP
jgi:predicted O-linked N-acetylglucosamine transferase (SPINDLY family)